jgi:hypothetical protein
MKKRPTKALMDMLPSFEEEVRLGLRGKKSGFTVAKTYQMFRDFDREDYLDKIVERIEKEEHPKKRKFEKIRQV